MQPNLISFLAALLLFQQVSAGGDPLGRIVFMGTKPAGERIKTLDLTPEQAATRITRFLVRENGFAEMRCRFILDDEYVFVSRLSKPELSIYGIYIDGKRGTVRRVNYFEAIEVYDGILAPRSSFLPRDWGEKAGYDGAEVKNPPPPPESDKGSGAK